MAERRTLTFATLDRVMPDVDRLLEGHETAGNWSLGQMCNHLSTVLVGSVDGFDAKVPWIIRNTLGRVIRRSILRTGTMRTGPQLPERFLPKSDLDDRAEAEALRAALNFFNGHNGEVAVHPLFGRLSRQEWTRLHCIHCAHHLSFAVPRASPGG